MCMSACVYLCQCEYVSISVGPCAHMFLHLSMCAEVCECLSLCLSECVHVCVSACLMSVCVHLGPGLGGVNGAGLWLAVVAVPEFVQRKAT